jgi:ribosomal protein S18 acetylase RimI-like enzyme
VSPSEPELVIRPFEIADEAAVIDLWHRCGLVVPWNDPHRDLALKLQVNPELFLVGTLDGCVVATVMAGYDGHRGWINYLGVDPDVRRRGLGRRIMAVAEAKLRERGCPKINLQVRTSNTGVIAFYERLGFKLDEVVSLGKRLG